MPDRSRCAHCHKVGLVRVEHIIQGVSIIDSYYCGYCDTTWTLPEIPVVVKATRSKSERRATPRRFVDPSGSWG